MLPVLSEVVSELPALGDVSSVTLEQIDEHLLQLISLTSDLRSWVAWFVIVAAALVVAYLFFKPLFYFIGRS